MYDRVIPYEIYESDEFIGLPNNTARIVYLALYHEADDFGNIETSPRYPSRWFASVFQIKTDTAMRKIMGDLCHADLIRTYDSGGVPCLHLPRFRNHRTYTRRIAPPSPWCDPDAPTGPFKAGARRENRTAGGENRSARIAKKINGADVKSESERRVQVGVGNETGNQALNIPSGTRLPNGWTLPDNWRLWAMEYAEAQRTPVTADQVVGFAVTFHDYWNSKQGAKGCRVDWFGTWRNWFRSSDLLRAASRSTSYSDQYSIGLRD